jgi:hypothetical protein
MHIAPPLAPPPSDASKADQQAWTDALRAILQESLPPELPEIPVAQRRWPWLTSLFN